MARPKKYNGEKLAKDLIEYINSTDDPMVEEFCLINDVSKDTVYRIAKECAKLSDAIKRVHLKQEIRTRRLVEQGKLNPTWAIFKLKQRRFGWSDKQEVEHSGKIDNTVEIIIGKEDD